MAIVLLRTIILFSSLLFFMRLLGKRQLGELELSELVVSVMIADLGALPLQDIGIPLMNGLLSILTLFCMELLLSGLTLRSVRLRKFVWGKPCFLIERGIIDQKAMRRCRFTVDELTEELRRQSILDLNTVQYAILETDGTLNVMLVPAQRPVTAAQLNVPTEDVGYPYILVSDGRTLTENLYKCGRDERWLQKECARQGVSGPKDIFLLMLDGAGRVYCAPKEGRT